MAGLKSFGCTVVDYVLVSDDRLSPPHWSRCHRAELR